MNLLKKRDFIIYLSLCALYAVFQVMVKNPTFYKAITPILFGATAMLALIVNRLIKLLAAKNKL